MKLYTLTRLYFKINNPAETLHENTLFLSTKYDIIYQRLNQEKQDMANFIKEIMECSEEKYTMNTLRDAQGRCLGYTYKTSNLIVALMLNELDYEKPQEETLIKPGCFATFKADIIDTLPHGLQGAKIVYVYKIVDHKATVNVQVTSSSNLGMQYTVPTDYLREYKV